MAANSSADGEVSSRPRPNQVKNDAMQPHAAGTQLDLCTDLLLTEANPEYVNDLHQRRSTLFVGRPRRPNPRCLFPRQECRSAMNSILLQPAVCWRFGVSVASTRSQDSHDHLIGRKTESYLPSLCPIIIRLLSDLMTSVDLSTLSLVYKIWKRLSGKSI